MSFLSFLNKLKQKHFETEGLRKLSLMSKSRGHNEILFNNNDVIPSGGGEGMV